MKVGEIFEYKCSRFIAYYYVYGQYKNSFMTIMIHATDNGEAGKAVVWDKEWFKIYEKNITIIQEIGGEA